MQDAKSKEASASEAAAQLIAEEEQQAAKAAAKKAKKVRQKQANRQALHLEAAESKAAQLAGLGSPHLPEKVSTAAEPSCAQSHLPGLSASQTDASTQIGSPVTQSGEAAPVPQSNMSDTIHVSSAPSKEDDQVTADSVSDPCAAGQGRTDGAQASPADRLVRQTHADRLANTEPSSVSQPAAEKACVPQQSDAKFLKNLFCCPITQVSCHLFW